MASTLGQVRGICGRGFSFLFKRFSFRDSSHVRFLSIKNDILRLKALSLNTFQPSAPAFRLMGNFVLADTPRRFSSKAKKTNKDSKKGKKAEEPKELSSEEDEDEVNVEVLRELRTQTGLEEKGHCVLVIQPDFKWGRNRFHLETVDHMLGEALGLVESLKDWKVLEARTEPIRKPDGRYFFGKGKLEELTKLVNELKKKSGGHFSAVFLDVGRLTRRQHGELEDLWGVKVFDRFGLVLQIFKERAVTSEAKLQVELAELGYIR